MRRNSMNKEILDNGIFYKEDKKVLMKVEFEKKDDYLIITSTFVDDSLRGQKKATFLMQEVIQYALENHLYIKATCSYAKSYFTKNPCDIYIDDSSL